PEINPPVCPGFSLGGSVVDVDFDSDTETTSATVGIFRRGGPRRLFPRKRSSRGGDLDGAEGLRIGDESLSRDVVDVSSGGGESERGRFGEDGGLLREGESRRARL